MTAADFNRGGKIAPKTTGVLEISFGGTNLTGETVAVILPTTFLTVPPQSFTQLAATRPAHWIHRQWFDPSPTTDRGNQCRNRNRQSPRKTMPFASADRRSDSAPNQTPPPSDHRGGGSAAGSMMASMGPGDLISLLLRRLPSIVLVSASVLAVILAALFFWPNSYHSDGLLYVRLGRGAVSVDPTSQAAEGVSIQDARASEVISVSEMLASREIADRVVRQVGAERINQPRTWMQRLQRQIEQVTSTIGGRGDGGIENRDQLIALERAAQIVQRSVGFETTKNGYTVKIAATTPDPILSRDIVQAYVDQYGAFHVEAHQTSGSFDFFDEQTEQSRAAALAAQQKLNARRSELGWMSPQKAEESIASRIVELDVALDNARSELAQSNQLTESLESQLQQIEPWIETESSVVPSVASDEMKASLYEAKIAESEALSKLKPDHPRYKRMVRKFEADQAAMADEEATATETTEAINPVYQQIEGELQLARAKAAGLKARRDSLEKSLAEAESKLAQLNHDSIELADLTLASEIANKNFKDQSESREQARLIEELDRQQLSDISVIQDASLNLKKSGPKRAALAVLGLLASLCLGLAQALVRPLPRSMQTKLRRRLADRVDPVHAVPPPAMDSVATSQYLVPQYQVPQYSAPQHSAPQRSVVPRGDDQPANDRELVASGGAGIDPPSDSNLSPDPNSSSDSNLSPGLPR